LLQEHRFPFPHSFKDFRRDCTIGLSDRFGDGFDGGGLRWRCRLLRIGLGREGLAACPALELDELLVLEQDAVVHAIGMLS
jgi:hypothetical protein